MKVKLEAYCDQRRWEAMPLECDYHRVGWDGDPGGVAEEWRRGHGIGSRTGLDRLFRPRRGEPKPL